MTSSAPDTPCPLCGNLDTTLLDTVDGPTLNAAWQRSCGIRPKIRVAQIAYRRCPNCDLHYFTPPEDGDADLYETLQRNDWYYLTDKPEYGLAHRHLPAEGPVLEVGAGKAAFAKFVEPRRYLGLEFNDPAIACAAQMGITLYKQTVQAHAESLPDHYAAVVSFQVLEHVADPASFVAACVRALAPGGILIFAVPDHDGLCGIAQNNILDMPPHHVSHWNERTLRFIGRHYGLEVISIEREPISAQHRPWAERAVVEGRLRSAFGLRNQVLDRRLAARLIAQVAARLARIVPPAIDKVGGHTILSVYRKLGP